MLSRRLRNDLDPVVFDRFLFGGETLWSQ